MELLLLGACAKNSQLFTYFSRLILKFQDLGRLTVLLSALIPFLTVVLISQHTNADSSPGLSICLGEGYRNFYSSQIKFCLYDNTFAMIACRFWLLLLVICMSNVFDIYWTYVCIKEINKQTEQTKDMLSQAAYIKRKR